MKKIIVILLATFLLQPAIAQLKNTRWEGAIKETTREIQFWILRKIRPFFIQLLITRWWKQ